MHISTQPIYFALSLFLLFSLVLLSGCICPPSDWQGAWPPWCEKPFLTKDSNGNVIHTTNFPFLKEQNIKDFLKGPNFWITLGSQMPTKEELETLGVDAITWVAFKFDDPLSYMYSKQNLNNFHLAGIHIIGQSMTPMHIISANPEKHTNKNLAHLDIYGNPIKVQKPGMSGYMSKNYWRNLLNPQWQKEMLDFAKKAFDLGMEGISMDEATFNSEVIFKAGGGFDNYSQTGFRKYLKEKYSEKELKELFDIKNIDSFNLKTYLKEKGIEDSWNKNPLTPSPIAYEFSLFQIKESNNFFSFFVKEMKKYAQSKNRAFLYAYNGSPNFSTHTLAIDYVDYLIGEHFYFQNSWECPKEAVVIKLAESMVPKYATLVEVAEDRGKVPSLTKNLFKYIFADIYSAKGTMIVSFPNFYTLKNWTYYSPDNFVKYDIKEAGKFVRFMKKHPSLFQTPEKADIAVIHSFASRRQNYWPTKYKSYAGENSIKGAIELLLNLNVPHKTIFSGDGEWIQKDFSLSDLKKYKIIVLPSVEVLSDTELTALLDFAKRGGIILQSGDFAKYNKKRQKRNDVPVFQKGENKIGKGKWFVFDRDIFNEYYGLNNAIHPTERKSDDYLLVSFKNILFKYWKPKIQTNTPPTLNIRIYEDDSHIVLHFVNYNYNQIKDSFAPIKPLKIKLKLEPSTKIKKIIFYDFENSITKELEFALADNSIEFTTPTITSYAVFELIK